ncbi:hypothetical protein SUGI_1176030 [Cryptomeria japonica]|nr:hypothetical protein SUGI_1176030 [Cryptomeria japonica]
MVTTATEELWKIGSWGPSVYMFGLSEQVSNPSLVLRFPIRVKFRCQEDLTVLMDLSGFEPGSSVLWIPTFLYLISPLVRTGFSPHMGSMLALGSSSQWALASSQHCDRSLKRNFLCRIDYMKF